MNNERVKKSLKLDRAIYNLATTNYNLQICKQKVLLYIYIYTYIAHTTQRKRCITQKQRMKIAIYSESVFQIWCKCYVIRLFLAYTGFSTDTAVNSFHNTFSFRVFFSNEFYLFPRRKIKNINFQ